MASWKQFIFTLLDGLERSAFTIAEFFGAGLVRDRSESVVLLLLLGDSMLSLLSLLAVFPPDVSGGAAVPDTEGAAAAADDVAAAVPKFTAKLLKQFFKSFCKFTYFSNFTKKFKKFQKNLNKIA